MKTTNSKAKSASAPKSPKRTTTVKRRRPRLSILRNDPWLEPYSEAIEGRHAEALRREKELVKGSRNAMPRHCVARKSW